MKIQIDGKIVYELDEMKKKVIQNDISSEIFTKDMERRGRHMGEHLYQQSLKKLKNEWIPKLCERVESLPTNDEKLCEIIFSQKDYKSRFQRDEEEKKLEHLRRTGQV